MLASFSHVAGSRVLSRYCPTEAQEYPHTLGDVQETKVKVAASLSSCLVSGMHCAVDIVNCAAASHPRQESEPRASAAKAACTLSSAFGRVAPGYATTGALGRDDSQQGTQIMFVDHSRKLQGQRTVATGKLMDYKSPLQSGVGDQTDHGPYTE